MVSLVVIFLCAVAALVLYQALKPVSARLAWVAAGALVVLGVALSAALLLNVMDTHPEVDPASVTHQWLETAPVEFGTRLKARFQNDSSARIHSLRGRVTNLDCEGSGCTGDFEIRIPIPVGRSYTHSWTVRVPSAEGDRWQLDLQQVLVYPPEQ